MFPSYDHPQRACIVPCKIYSLKTISDLHRYVKLMLWQHAAHPLEFDSATHNVY